MFFFVQVDAYAQSEEDILNSIGAELENEAEAKKKREAAEKQYESLKSKADPLFKAGKFDKAEPLYKEMENLFPDKDYPKRQLAVVEQKLEEERAAKAEELYKSLIAAADQLLAQEKWDAAKLKYEEAIKAKSDESYPKTKIADITKLKKEAEDAKKQAEVQAKYDASIALADKALENKQWDAAVKQYEDASKIKPSEKYPKDQILKAAQLKKDAEEAAKQDALNKQYDAAIAEADKLLGLKQWDAAKEKYLAAQKLKPQEVYPKTQIAKADELKKQEADAEKQAKIDAEYTAAIKEADALLKTKNWDGAVAKYEVATKVKPAEAYPKEQIAAAKQAKIDAEYADKQAKIDAEYTAAIKEADALLKTKDWDGAVAKYEVASKVKPAEAYPKEQISAAKQAKADAENADKQAAIQEKYNAQIGDADKLFASKEYDAAIARYEEAKNTKPNESYPTTQIEKARLEKSKLQNEAEKKAEFDKYMNEGNTAIQAEELDKAIASFEAAISIFPKDTEAVAKLKESKDKKLRFEQESKAKAEMESKAAKIEAEYKELIAKADKAFEAKNFTESKGLYINAQKLKPEETYPSQQLDNIDKALEADKEAQKQAAEAEKAKQQALEETFAKLIQDGDFAMSKNDFAAAKKAYEEAKGLKPNSTTPDTKLKELERQEALKQSEALKEIEIQKQAEAQKEKYNLLINDADKAVEKKNWSQAISLYKQASDMVPTEKYPKDQLVKIDGLIAEEETEKKRQAQAEKEQKRELENNYSSLMTKGEDALRTKKWDEAIAFFEEASGLKKEAQGPKERIDEVRRLRELEEEAGKKAEEQARKGLEIENQYKGLITMGDKALESRNFEEARKHYGEALKLKPNESYPKDQIEKAAQLKQIADAEEAKSQQEEARKRAEDLVKQKEEEAAKRKKEEEEALKQAALASKEQKYQDAMDKGQAALEAYKFDEALKQFEAALELKKEDAEAARKLQVAIEGKELYMADQAEKRKADEAKRKADEEEARKMAKALAEERQRQRLEQQKESNPEELANKYPSGVTTEVIDEGYRQVTRNIVVESGKGRQLFEVEYPFGLYFYYLNNKQITGDAYKHDLRKYKR